MASADLLLGAGILPLYTYLFLGTHYHFWTAATLNTSLLAAFNIISGVLFQASLISATFMSIERLYAFYWPMRHRTLSKPAYRIAIFVVWILALIGSTGFFVFRLLISEKLALYTLVAYLFILLSIVCGCNIAIRRKFQRAGSIASLQRNRVSQNQRLTRTLMFVSVVVLLSWLPNSVVNLIRFMYEISSVTIYIVVALAYFNSVANPFVYALRIPEMRRSLGLRCFRRQTMVDRKVNERRNNRTAAVNPVTQPSTLPTEPSALNMAYEQEAKL